MALSSNLGGHRFLGSWSWHVEAGIFTAGPAIAAAFNVDAEKARLGAPIADFFPAVHPDDRERFEADVSRSVETRSEFFCEYRVVARDGTVRHLWDHGQCLEQQCCRPDMMLGVVIDVTESAASNLMGSALHLAEARRLLASSDHAMLRYFIDMAMMEMATTVAGHERRLRSLNS